MCSNSYKFCIQIWRWKNLLHVVYDMNCCLSCQNERKMHCQVIMIMLVNNKSLNKVNKQDLKFSLQLRLSQTSYESMRKRGGGGGHCVGLQFAV
jgi:hypothetical protein